MAIIDRRRFRRRWHYDWQSGALVICDYELVELFDVPFDSREIWITIRDRKTASSRRMQIDRDIAATLVDESGVRYYCYRSVAKYLRRLYERGIKTIHVEVEYEE